MAGFIGRYGREEIENILKISGNRAFSPLSSGAGRLFDAVSALTGVCDRNTFEGEAAIALEAVTLDDIHEDYPVDVIFKDPMEIDFSMTFLSILKDMERKVDIRVIASKFHNTVSSSIINVVLKLSQINNIRKVVLSGGVFQNFYLLNRVMNGLLPEGLVVAVNELVPCNDAGISLGQAYILRERLRGGWACGG
jgi:hydrogenase maturation protein HypF